MVVIYFDLISPAFYGLHLLLASVHLDQTLTAHLHSGTLPTSYKICDSTMMGSWTLDYGIILIFAATVKVCIGNFYKIEYHELTSLDNRVLYDDAFKCDRKETCKQFTTYASLSSNRSPRIDHELNIIVTKMPGMIIFLLLIYARKQEAFPNAMEIT